MLRAQPGAAPATALSPVNGSPGHPRRLVHLRKTFGLKIGGLLFVVRSPVPVMLDINDPSYSSFYCASTPGRKSMSVRIMPGGLVPRDAYDRVFDADGMWTLSQRSGKRLVSWTGGAHGTGRWTARLSPDFSRVEVRCGKEYMGKAGGTVFVRNPARYPLDQMLAIYALSCRSGLIFHACGAVYGGKAFVFAGISGAGKSTISGLLGKAGWTVLSDDRIVVRRAGNGFRAYGTPWPGDAGAALNESAPLSGIVLLSKSRKNRIVGVAGSVALARLLPAVSIPWHDQGVCRPALSTLDRILAAVPVFNLDFTPGPAAVKTVAKTLFC